MKLTSNVFLLSPSSLAYAMRLVYHMILMRIHSRQPIYLISVSVVNKVKQITEIS